MDAQSSLDRKNSSFSEEKADYGATDIVSPDRRLPQPSPVH